ncbi:MAG: ribonucleotide-diphosphate reductase subunit alpha, partial [Erythrobacter sp.]|nr:ribonucleotide-diphosphate reductase subunit alpha [Erythrobacter sp.]
MGQQMDFKASDNVPGDVVNELDAGTPAEAQAGAEMSAGDEKAVTMNKADAGSEELIAAKAGEALAGALAQAGAEAGKGATDSKKVNARRFTVVTDASRDARL